jgi:hypothetical protein
MIEGALVTMVARSQMQRVASNFQKPTGDEF